MGEAVPKMGELVPNDSGLVPKKSDLIPSKREIIPMYAHFLDFQSATLSRCPWGKKQWHTCHICVFVPVFVTARVTVCLCVMVTVSMTIKWQLCNHCLKACFIRCITNLRTDVLHLKSLWLQNNVKSAMSSRFRDRALTFGEKKWSRFTEKRDAIPMIRCPHFLHCPYFTDALQ